MKKLWISALLTIAMPVLFFSCKKNPVQIKTKTELLTQTSWKFDHATASGVDISSQIPVCLKDNITTFVSNGTGTIDESTNVCSPTTAGNFTWNFQSNETIINLSVPLFPGGSGNFTVVTLNETNFILSQDMVIPPMTSAVNVVVTLKH